MTTIKKLIPLLSLTLFQFGCVQQPFYQAPAPVYRTQPRAADNAPSSSAQTYKYPETGAIQEQPSMQELAPPMPAIASPPPPTPSIPSAPFSPAVLALVSEADLSSQRGEYESAAVKIERALRIDSRNAALTYKLAVLRLKQEQPRLAEDLAKKAALLAGKDRNLKKRIWLLIAESKRLQHDPEGAIQAEQKAAEY